MLKDLVQYYSQNNLEEPKREDIFSIESYLSFISDNIICKLDASSNLGFNDTPILEKVFEHSSTYDLYQLMQKDFTNNQDLKKLWNNYKSNYKNIFEFSKTATLIIFSGIFSLKIDCRVYKITQEDIRNFLIETNKHLSESQIQNVYKFSQEAILFGKLIKRKIAIEALTLLEFAKLESISQNSEIHNKINAIYISYLKNQINDAIGHLNEYDIRIKNVEEKTNAHFSNLLEVMGILIAVFSIIGLSVNAHNLNVSSAIQLCLLIVFAMCTLCFLLALLLNDRHKKEYIDSMDIFCTFSFREAVMLFLSIVSGLVLICCSHYLS